MSSDEPKIDSDPPVAKLPPEPKAGTGFTRFTFDVYEHLEKTDNMCVSPFGVAVSLSSLHPGMSWRLCG